MTLPKVLLSPFPPIPASSKYHHQTPKSSPQVPKTHQHLLSSLTPLALVFTLNSPLPSLAISPFTSQGLLSPPTTTITTPYSQSQSQQLGLDNGKIRPCPAVNPGCISTNPKSSSFAFPWMIPEDATANAIQRLRDAIMKTQKNASIKVDEETSNGHYLQAEIDGAFGRDVIELLVKNDVVAYRSMAMKVTFIYPFTTAFGDSKGQQERMNRIIEDLGWFSQQSPVRHLFAMALSLEHCVRWAIDLAAAS